MRDARDLADLLRMGRLAEGWIAPPQLRQLRELVRYRAKLVALRSALKAQVHAVLAKEGVAMTDLFGKQGMTLLREVRLGTCYRMRVESLLELIDAFDHEVLFFSDAIAARLRYHRGYRAIQAIPGVGATFAAVFVVEIGDITRFARPGQLCSWAGLTPEHHESDTTIIRGHVTKQGSRLVRWAAVEAVQVRPHDVNCVTTVTASPHAGPQHRQGRGRPPVLELVYWGLRDGHPLPGTWPPHSHRFGRGMNVATGPDNRRRALYAVHDPEPRRGRPWRLSPPAGRDAHQLHAHKRRDEWHPRPGQRRTTLAHQPLELNLTVLTTRSNIHAYFFVNRMLAPFPPAASRSFVLTADAAAGAPPLTPPDGPSRTGTQRRNPNPP